MSLLRKALAYREQWILDHPPEPGPEGIPVILKPPFCDGMLFSSMFEGPTGFAIGRVVKSKGTYRVSVDQRYDERGQPTVRWTDVAVVVKEDDRYVVDDIELLGAWPFGYHGRVSDILKVRE